MRRTCHSLSRGGRCEARGYTHWNAISCGSPLPSPTHLRDRAKKCAFMKNGSHYWFDPVPIFDADPPAFYKIDPHWCISTFQPFAIHSCLLPHELEDLVMTIQQVTTGTAMEAPSLPPTEITRKINLAPFVAARIPPGTEHLLNPDLCRWTDCVLSLELLVYYCGR